MATPARIREVAFHVLFQLDVHAAGETVGPFDGTDEEPLTGRDRAKAEAAARGAYEHRAEADAAIERYAPGWPAHRQPAVDRAILRLAHYEIVSKRCEPKIAVNEAIELAKEFSTDRSPAFVNGLLDKILKRAMGLAPEPLSAEELDEADAAQASENGDDGGGSGEPASPDRASNTPPFEESQT